MAFTQQERAERERRRWDILYETTDIDYGVRPQISKDAARTPDERDEQKLLQTVAFLALVADKINNPPVL
jgi:hypothetical protein